MTGTAQERPQARRRPASGVVIDPEQLTRMRDLRGLSRAGLAAHTGRLLFDYDQFYRVLAGTMDPEPRMVRVLWLALGCRPQDIVSGLPPDLPPAEVSPWLKAHDGWFLNRVAVTRLRGQRPVIDDDGVVTGHWQPEDLAAAAGRYWFSRDEVNKIEQGSGTPSGRRPKSETLAAFCKVLQCEPVDLMPGSRPLPDGATSARRDLLDFNRGMRAYADEHGICYRDDSGRIKYDIDPRLREEYAAFLAGQDGRELIMPSVREAAGRQMQAS